MRSERGNDPNPSTWYPSDDDEKTYKCPECGEFFPEEEMVDGSKWFDREFIYNPETRMGEWIPRVSKYFICEGCKDMFVSSDEEDQRWVEFWDNLAKEDAA